MCIKGWRTSWCESAILERQIFSGQGRRPRLHPNLAKLYRRKVQELEAALRDPTSRDEAMEMLRSRQVPHIEVLPAKEGFDIEFVGDIAKMIIVAHPEKRFELERFKNSVKVVAEEGFGRYHNIKPKPILI